MTVIVGMKTDSDGRYKPSNKRPVVANSEDTVDVIQGMALPPIDERAIRSWRFGMTTMSTVVQQHWVDVHDVLAAVQTSLRRTFLRVMFAFSTDQLVMSLPSCHPVDARRSARGVFHSAPSSWPYFSQSFAR